MGCWHMCTLLCTHPPALHAVQLKLLALSRVVPGMLQERTGNERAGQQE